MEKVEDYRDPEVLRRLYWDEGLSVEDIAFRLYVSTTTVRDYMRKNGIPTGRGRKPEADLGYRDKEVLKEYIRQGMTNKDIAKKAGVKPGAILKWLKRYGLQNTNSKPIARYDVGGRMLTVAEMAAESGLTKSNIQSRLQRGWRPEAAMAVPSLEGTKYVRGPLAVKLRKEGKFEYGVYYQGSDRGNSGRNSGRNHGR